MMDNEIDILVIWEIVARWWWLTILLPVLAGAAGFVFSYEPPEPVMYLSTSTILLDDRSQGEVFTSLATSPAFLDRARAEHGLRISLRDLIKQVSATGVSPQVVAIKVEHLDEMVALHYGQAITKTLLAFMESVRKTQLAEVSKELAANPLLAEDKLYPKFTPYSRATAIGHTISILPHDLNKVLFRNTLLGSFMGLLLAGVFVFILEGFRAARKRRDSLLQQHQAMINER